MELTKEQAKLVRDFKQVRDGAAAGMEQGDIVALSAAVLRLELLLRELYALHCQPAMAHFAVALLGEEHDR